MDIFPFKPFKKQFSEAPQAPLVEKSSKSIDNKGFVRGASEGACNKVSTPNILNGNISKHSFFKFLLKKTN